MKAASAVTAEGRRALARLALAAALALAATGRSQAAAPQVTWMTIANAPPFYVSEGPEAGAGAGDMALDYLAAALPQIGQTRLQATPVRIWYEISHADAVCSFGMLRTPEREAVGVFSARPVILPGYRLVLRQGDDETAAAARAADGRITLSRLHSDRDRVGGYIPTRAYPDPIAALIAAPPAGYRMAPYNTIEQMFALLLAGRIDFVIANGIDYAFITSKLGDRAQFKTEPITNAASSISVFTACSKGPIGRTMIHRVDQLLADDRHWTAFIAPWRRWMTPDAFATALSAPAAK